MVRKCKECLPRVPPVWLTGCLGTEATRYDYEISKQDTTTLEQCKELCKADTTDACQSIDWREGNDPLCKPSVANNYQCPKNICTWVAPLCCSVPNAR